MKFSVCIPNYNYAAYLPRTLASVLDQSHGLLEVLVADNASTDDSVAVVRAVGDDRVVLKQNRCNVGFARNLDMAARMATGDRIIMLSSDDLIRADTLARYATLAQALGSEAPRAVFSATWDVIDAHDHITGRNGPDARIWRAADRDARLERLVGAPVYRVEAGELLRRCALTMKNPFNFAATCYPRALYEQLEGYGGGRMINPDKWFHWRLLGIAGTAFFVDAPLFAYRWHAKNQTAQQASTGALKYLIDEYATVLELDDAALLKAGLRREDVEKSFIEHDILRHGLAVLAQGDVDKARRIYDFGCATYPWRMHKDPRAVAFGVLVRTGAAGATVARAAHALATRQGLTTVRDGA